MIEVIFDRIGTTDRFFVEFGVGDATECNTARLLDLGWKGLMMDASAETLNPRATVRREFLTADNANAVFAKHGVPREFDLLSIDVDGNDYWIWRSLDHRPRVVVIEYNAHVPPDEAKTISYEPDFKWSGTDYFGASLLAVVRLGESKGYTLVHCERAGVNAFFVRTDVARDHFVKRPVAEIYRPPNYGYAGHRFPKDPARELATVD